MRQVRLSHVIRLRRRTLISSDFYCASCHGRDGQWCGHVASTLENTAGTDLTLLTQ